MSTSTPNPTFFQQTKKAFTAAGVAFVGSVAASIQPILQDGKIEGTEVAVALAVAVGVAAAAFGATFGVTNAKGNLSNG
jgi:hypothetical protein